jgi:hypothetical protein
MRCRPRGQGRPAQKAAASTDLDVAVGAVLDRVQQRVELRHAVGLAVRQHQQQQPAAAGLARVVAQRVRQHLRQRRRAAWLLAEERVDVDVVDPPACASAAWRRGVPRSV